MRYLMVHKLDEAVPGNFEPSPQFLERMKCIHGGGRPGWDPARRRRAL